MVYIFDPFRQIAMAIRSQTIKNLSSINPFLATVRKTRQASVKKTAVKQKFFYNLTTLSRAE